MTPDVNSIFQKATWRAGPCAGTSIANAFVDYPTPFSNSIAADPSPPYGLIWPVNAANLHWDIEGATTTLPSNKWRAAKWDFRTTRAETGKRKIVPMTSSTTFTFSRSSKPASPAGGAFLAFKYQAAVDFTFTVEWTASLTNSQNRIDFDIKLEDENGQDQILFETQVAKPTGSDSGTYVATLPATVNPRKFLIAMSAGDNGTFTVTFPDLPAA